MAHAPLSRIEELAEKLQLVPCEPSRGLQLQEDLEALQRMARWIQARLNDAEEMEIHDGSVRLWLKELKGVAYDAEDVLDEYDYELLRAKVEAGIQNDQATHHLPYKRKHQEVSQSTITSITSDASFCGQIADKIGQIRGRFEVISQLRDALHLPEGDRGRQPLVIADRPPSSHIVDEPIICGRSDDMEKVINQLLCSDECQKSNLSVLPIVGMGGVGKTTLVQHVYKDQRICDYFQMKGWVCVSDDFTVEKLTARIIESLTGEECHVKEFSVLQQKLTGLLNGKRFLLVLDDVWNENRGLWESLRKPLRFGVQGSAVITTTRNESVAVIMKTMPFHRLDCLCDDDCLQVFKQSAFVDRDPNDCQDLMEIGEKIVRKCGGLPLAAKSLGGLLSSETEVVVWEGVLQSNIWDLEGDGIIPALRLSYLHLPSYLKQCFLYASVFPKDFRLDFRFTKEDLIRLWMAQGFIRCKGSEQAEDVGNTYFNKLVQRSFFQYDPKYLGEDARPEFVMHDLIHDLAQQISGQEFFRIEGDEAHVPCPNDAVRHLSVTDRRLQDLEKVSRKLLALRTLKVLGIARLSRWEFRSQMIPHLEFLRALDLGHSGINKLPDSIGNLKHLRYLKLDHTFIERLTDSVCKLYNLQTLSLVGCRQLRRLPEDIKNLCNLRCLRTQHSHIQFLPRGFGALTSLCALDEFMVGYDFSPPPSNVECCGIEELKDLIRLRGTLVISNLKCVMNAEDARLADLRNKRDIKRLVLHWGRLRPGLTDGHLVLASPDVQMMVMENLRPPDRLEELEIERYKGPRPPSWMADDPSSFSRLVRVTLDDCPCTSLPPLGQLPSLKFLDISGLDNVEAVGIEFYGHASVGFPALEVLIFLYMEKWATWALSVGRGDFPRLRRLVLCACNRLESIGPLYLLPALKELLIWGCSKLESMGPLYLLPALEDLRIKICSMLMRIELWGGPSCTGLPPLKKLLIQRCPRIHFSPEEAGHLLQLPMLRDFDIECSSVAEWWCAERRGNRLAHIPDARVRTTEDGDPIAVYGGNGEQILWDTSISSIRRRR